MRTTFKPQIKKPRFQLSPLARMLLIYFVCTATAFALLAGIGAWLSSSVRLAFIFMLLGVTGLGIFHIWLMYRYFEWDDPYRQKIIFTLVVAVTGIVVFLLFFANSNLPYSFIPLGFSIPLFFQAATENIDAIPPKFFKSYRITTFDDVDRERINFTGSKGLMWIFSGENPGDLPTLPVRMFAPEQVYEMRFNTLFKASVLFYNVRINEEIPIHIFKENEVGDREAYEWYFTYNAGFLSGTKFIDPDKTLPQNGLRFKKEKTSNGGEIQALKIFVTRRSVTQINES